MSNARFILDFLVYDDTASTNDPKEVKLKWHTELVLSNYENHLDGEFTFATGDHTLTLPAASVNYLYIETDQALKLRLNGMTGDQVTIEPTTAGARNGQFFKRGAVTQIVINVPGADAANVFVAMGV